MKCDAILTQVKEILSELKTTNDYSKFDEQLKKIFKSTLDLLELYHINDFEIKELVNTLLHGLNTITIDTKESIYHLITILLPDFIEEVKRVEEYIKNKKSDIQMTPENSEGKFQEEQVNDLSQEPSETSETDNIVDDELIEIFSEEAEEIIVCLNQMIEVWEKDEDNTEHIKGLKRELHTLKGGARMVKQQAISTLAHELETFYERLLSEECVANAKVIALSREVLDALFEQVQSLKHNQSIDVYSEILNKLTLNLDDSETISNGSSSEYIDENQLEEIDPELIEIFIEEAEEILEQLGAMLDLWRKEPKNYENIISLQRELHTLKGGARMVNQSHISQVAHELESVYEEISINKKEVSQDFIDKCEKQHDNILELIQKLKAGESPPNINKYLLVLGEMRNDVLPEDDNQDSIIDLLQDDIVDQELVDIFCEEAHEIFEQVSEMLEAWHLKLNDELVLTSLQRELHTLKGGARMVNQENISKVAHTLESFYEKMGKKEISADEQGYQLAVRVHDHLNKMIEQLKENKTVRIDSELLSELETNIGIKDTVVQQPSSSAKIDQETDSESLSEAQNFDIKKSEMIRIRSELLEQMNNLAVENNIITVHVEQQVSSIRGSLRELSSTFNKCLEQVRELEIEAESQRTKDEQEKQDKQVNTKVEKNDDFDALEMDRYTNLDQISSALGETIRDLMNFWQNISGHLQSAEELLVGQFRVSSDLQENLLKTRMVSFGSVLPRLKRIVRQISGELDKNVELNVLQAEGDMDRTTLDKLLPMLEHMIRNSIDHGIEVQALRTQRGKAAKGRIDISLERTGTDVAITLADDGGGIDVAGVKKKAISLGLIAQEDNLPDEEIVRHILTPGFSTKDVITEISGRGVGMDVVNAGIKELGGSLMIDSKTSHGSEFNIRLPFTLSLNRAFLFSVHDQLFGIQISSLQAIGRIRIDEFDEYFADENAGYKYGDKIYSLKYIGKLLNISERPQEQRSKTSFPVIILHSSGYELAILVDNFIGVREVMIKSIGPQFKLLPSCLGASVGADGSIVMILDPVELGRLGKIKPKKIKKAQITNSQTVMVVDDSLTVRKVTSRLLERNNYRVVAARDGIDAIDVLERENIDIMLIDLEMPRMDGFELTSYIRNNHKFQNIPIIMITSRTGSKHQERAKQLNIDVFLGKPYQENDLLDHISTLLKGAHTDG